MSELLEGLDHPLLFVVAVGLALIGFYGVAKWAAMELGLHGVAAALPA